MEKEKHPISRIKDKRKSNLEWEFIKEVEGTYEDALKEAGKLQSENKGYQYRIWDCR